MSYYQEKIYPILPLFAQNIAISTYGYYWKKRRMGGVFKQQLIKFKDRESYSYDKWLQYQTDELRKILVHAFNNVPLYHEKYSRAGINLTDLERIDLANLNKLPILSKDELRQFGTTLLLNKNKKLKGAFLSSSGSTGTPSRIFFSKEMHQKWSAAYEARVRNWAGINRYNSRGMIGGRRIVVKGLAEGPYHRYNIFEKQIYFSAYHISASTVKDYASALWKYKPDYMTGYAMSNFILARFFEEGSINVPVMKAVITSSEKLTPKMRMLFGKIYGCKAYDSYSGVEACGLISENEFSQLLISPDVGIMEILHENGEPCKPGEVGEIYSTGFLNYDQPLIRYRIGDKVRLAKDQKTLCGRSMILIDEIIGRDEDIVQGPDGRQMVRFHGLYIDISGLIAGQLIQHDLRRYTIKLQIDKERFDRPGSENLIKYRIISQLGEVSVKFEYPENIPTGPNGKFKAVISEIGLF